MTSTRPLRPISRQRSPACGFMIATEHALRCSNRVRLLMKLAAIACSSLLAVACASPEEATSSAQEPSPPSQDQHDQGDGTPAIETEQEAKEVALWFLRGRGFLGEQVQVETRAFELDGSWHVLVVTPRFEAFDTHCSVEIAESGYSIRMSPGR